jgi:general secretion pathway protein J
MGMPIRCSLPPFTPIVSGINDKAVPNCADPFVPVREPDRVSFAYASSDHVWKETWYNADELPRAVRVSVRDVATQ